MRVHYLQHIHFEGPSNIVNWTKRKGHKLTGTHLYNYETVPKMNEFDCLIIMGGPMNIYEEEKYPWLKYEKNFIKEAIDNNKIVLGICLGAQLITDVIGGKVTNNPHGEIGWLPVKFNEEALKIPFFKNFKSEVDVFQWHNDTFSTLGSGAIPLARSSACLNQAFIYKDCVIGFQFHLESTEESIGLLINNCRDELVEGTYIQDEEQIGYGMHLLEEANQLMDDLLDQMELYFLEKEQL